MAHQAHEMHQINQSPEKTSPYRNATPEISSPCKKKPLEVPMVPEEKIKVHTAQHTPQGGAPFTHRKVPEPAPYNSVNVVRYRVHAPAPARLQFPIDAGAPPAVLHNPVSPRPGGRVAEALSRGACWERPKSHSHGRRRRGPLATG
ncbi:hypothetical protein GQ607_006398 [Colletotrichum asianum]|uniref:Uncharacterized protein n=1 Tax=Colletotrichum asianum TaxID=702518 RepID=A0A8H3ZP45_9PEZI|nr:hypothetical protein GQ607_006398 [Colletotrichum asianum]